MVHDPNGHNNQSWAREKSGASSKSSTGVAGVQVLQWSAAFLRTLARSWMGSTAPRNKNKHPYRWNAGVTDSFTCNITMLDSK